MKNVSKKAWMVVTAAAVAIGATVLTDAWAQSRPAASAPADPVGVAPVNTRVAVIDLVKVFANYQKAKDLEVKLQTQRKTVKAEDEKRTKKIESMEQTLKELDPTSQEYQKQLDELTKASIERDVWLKFEDSREMQERYRLTDEMYKEITRTVADAAKAGNFQIVLNSDDSNAESKPDIFRKIDRKKVLYAEASLDLTETVLLRLNDAYKAGKK